MRLVIAGGEPVIGGEHLQQAIEKFMKGWLLGRGWRLIRTHELSLLLDAAIVHAPHLESFRDMCERLSEYYLVERYPGSELSGAGAQLPTLAEVRQSALEAMKLVAHLFPDEVLDAP